MVVDFITRGQFARDCRAEVTEFLGTQSGLGFELRGQVGLDIDVCGDTVTAAISLVARLKAGESLTACVAANTDAIGIDIRPRLARLDLIILAPVFSTERQIHAVGNSGVKTAHVEICC